jgi:hypothetical protein
MLVRATKENGGDRRLLARQLALAGHEVCAIACGAHLAVNPRSRLTTKRRPSVSLMEK